MVYDYASIRQAARQMLFGAKRARTVAGRKAAVEEVSRFFAQLRADAAYVLIRADDDDEAAAACAELWTSGLLTEVGKAPGPASLPPGHVIVCDNPENLDDAPPPCRLELCPVTHIARAVSADDGPADACQVVRHLRATCGDANLYTSPEVGAVLLEKSLGFRQL